MRRSFPISVKVVLTISALLVVLLAPSAPAMSAPLLFGTKEIASRNVAPFTKWTRILDVVQNGEKSFACLPSAGGCATDEWSRFIESLAGLDRARQLEAVNTLFNGARYVSDDRNYGVGDYWATPRQLMTRGGDCEDYAIAKYLALRALGVSPEEMRIVVLQDQETHRPHAILVVYHEGRAYALDNQLARVTDAARIHYYKPLYSINETGWWYHVS